MTLAAACVPSKTREPIPTETKPTAELDRAGRDQSLAALPYDAISNAKIF
jgi:hypothetical protein